MPLGVEGHRGAYILRRDVVPGNLVDLDRVDDVIGVGVGRRPTEVELAAQVVDPDFVIGIVLRQVLDIDRALHTDLVELVEADVVDFCLDEERKMEHGLAEDVHCQATVIDLELGNDPRCIDSRCRTFWLSRPNLIREPEQVLAKEHGRVNQVDAVDVVMPDFIVAEGHFCQREKRKPVQADRTVR